MKSLKLFFIIVTIIFLTTSSGCASSPNRFSLDVIQVIDERFEYLDEQQVKIILAKISKIMKEKYDVNLKFNFIKTIIYENFRSQYNTTNEYDKYKVDVFNLENDKNLVPYIYYDYKDKYTIGELREFINGKYALEPSDDYKDIVGMLLAIHRQKIDGIKTLVLNDQSLLLKKDKFEENSSINWASIVKTCKYDLIITNFLIIDDFYDIPPHSLIRGGVLFGVTPKSNAKYGATATVSIFPIITRLNYFVKERGYYKSEEELDMIAYCAIQELFHSLFKYDDDYSIKNCPINPIRNMHIKEWYENMKNCKKFNIPSKKAVYYNDKK